MNENPMLKDKGLPPFFNLNDIKTNLYFAGNEEVLLRTYAVQFFPVKLPYGRRVMGRRKILTVMIYLITEHKDQIFLSVTLVKIWSEQPCLDRSDQSVDIQSQL